MIGSVNLHRRVFAPVFVAVLLLTGCSKDNQPAQQHPTQQYTERLNQVDERIVVLAKQVRTKPDQWLVHEQLANAYLERGQLTGNYSDYEHARTSLSKAFSIAPKGSGPWLTSAAFDLSIHLLAPAQRALAKIDQRPLLNKRERGTIAGLNAEIRWHQNDHDGALSGYQAAVNVDRSPANLARLAYAKARTGNRELAEQLYDGALELAEHAPNQTKSWLWLQKGLLDLDAGNAKLALQDYRQAEQYLAGWWLIDEHIAEVLALLGKHDQAKKLYEDVIKRSGHPEFIDALAELEQQDDPERAQQLITQARVEHERRMTLFPAAAAGHAIDHYLAFSPTDPRTLEVARLNHSARPSIDSALPYAEALIAHKRDDAARQLLDKYRNSSIAVDDCQELLAVLNREAPSN